MEASCKRDCSEKNRVVVAPYYNPIASFNHSITAACSTHPKQNIEHNHSQLGSPSFLYFRLNKE